MEKKKVIKTRKVKAPGDITQKELKHITILLTEIREILENIWRERTPS